MLKVDRENRTLSRIDTSSLSDAQILERTDLQECIYNASDDFFAEIGERVFVIGQEIRPSQTVQDRIDLLGIDPEGTSVIVELKRGSNKLQMLQAISYAGMVSRWTADNFRAYVPDSWERLEDFLEVGLEDLNRQQRILLVAEAYDYALLAGAEWLSEKHGVDIRCASVSLVKDATTGAEYLVCTSIFPPPALAEQAAAREGSRQVPRPLRWSTWDEALSHTDNEPLRAFVREELSVGRENYLRRRAMHYRLDGKRRWSLFCRNEHGYVWQRGRFEEDLDFWQSRLSERNSVKPVKKGKAISFKLISDEDLSAFREAVTDELVTAPWYKVEEEADEESDQFE